MDTTRGIRPDGLGVGLGATRPAPPRPPLREIRAPNGDRRGAGGPQTSASAAAAEWARKKADEWARKNDEVISRIVSARERQQSLLRLPFPAPPPARAGEEGAERPSQRALGAVSPEDLDGVAQLLSALGEQSELASTFSAAGQRLHHRPGVSDSGCQSPGDDRRHELARRRQLEESRAVLKRLRTALEEEEEELVELSTQWEECQVRRGSLRAQVSSCQTRILQLELEACAAQAGTTGTDTPGPVCRGGSDASADAAAQAFEHTGCLDAYGARRAGEENMSWVVQAGPVLSPSLAHSPIPAASQTPGRGPAAALRQELSRRCCELSGQRVASTSFAPAPSEAESVKKPFTSTSPFSCIPHARLFDSEEAAIFGKSPNSAASLNGSEGCDSNGCPQLDVPSLSPSPLVRHFDEPIHDPREAASPASLSSRLGDAYGPADSASSGAAPPPPPPPPPPQPISREETATLSKPGHGKRNKIKRAAAPGDAGITSMMDELRRKHASRQSARSAESISKACDFHETITRSLQRAAAPKGADLAVASKDFLAAALRSKFATVNSSQQELSSSSSRVNASIWDED